MLQARLFSYNDAVRYRLGVNFYQIPVNAPKCPYMSYHRDGNMRVDGNLGGTTSFNPNSAGLWDNQPEFAEPPLPIEGQAAHYDHYADDDHWEQPGNLFRLMTPAQQQVLFENTARAMGDARQHIKERFGLRRGGRTSPRSRCQTSRRLTVIGHAPSVAVGRRYGNELTWARPQPAGRIRALAVFSASTSKDCRRGAQFRCSSAVPGINSPVRPI
jgi:hypothetical protein